MILKESIFLSFQNVSLTPAKWTRLLHKYISQIATGVSCELDWSLPHSILDLLAPYDCTDPSAHQRRLALCMPCLKILGHVDFSREELLYIMNCYVYIVFRPWRLQGLCYCVSLKLGILGKLKEIKWWIVMNQFAVQMTYAAGELPC